MNWFITRTCVTKMWLMKKSNNWNETTILNLSLYITYVDMNNIVSYREMFMHKMYSMKINECHDFVQFLWMPYLILNKDLLNKLKHDETDYSAHHLTNKKQIKVSPNNQLIIIENKIYRKSKKYKFITHEKFTYLGTISAHDLVSLTKSLFSTI